MTREERLAMLRARNAEVRSPSVTWLLSEVDRLERELLERVTALRVVLRDIADLAAATEPTGVLAHRYASASVVKRFAVEALAADDAAAQAGPA